MLKEVGMESVHSQNDHHPDMEARTERVVTVSDSELEEPGTASPEPSGQRCAEEHSPKRVEQLSVESVNDTGQHVSSVGPDHVLNSVDCGSSLFKTIDSKETSGLPDHSLAHKGSDAGGGISMESGARTDGPQNPPPLEDTAECLGRTERPQDLSGQQLNTISSKEGCHQEDKATGVKEVSTQPGYSPESKEIHDQTDDSSKSTETSHQTKNTKEYDTVNDPQKMAREHKETTDQSHNTTEREDTADQPHNTTEREETADQPHNITEREETADQPNNTTQREETADQSHNTTEKEETADQSHNTTEREESTDQPHSTTEREESTDQPHNTTEREESTDQPHNTKEREETADQQHNKTEREESTDQPHNTMEREETADQPHNTTEREESTDQPHNTKEREDTADQSHNITEREETADQPNNTTEREKSTDQPHNTTEREESTDQPHNTKEREETADQLNNTTEREETADLPHNTTEREESTDQPHNTTEREETADQPHNTTEREESTDQPHNTKEREETADQPHNTMEREESTDQPHNTKEREESTDQEDHVLKSMKNNNKAHNTPNRVCDQAENTTKSEIRDYSDAFNGQANSTGGPIEVCEEHSSTSNTNIHEKPNNSMEFKEIGDQQPNTRDYVKISDLLQTTIECEEISGESPIAMELNEMNEQPEKSTSSDEKHVQPHSVINCKTIYDQVLDSTESEGVIDNPEHSAEVNEIGDQTHTITQTKGIDNEAGTNEESKEPSDKVHHITESGDFNDPDRITMSDEISTQSANITELKDNRYKPENIIETIEVSVRSVNARESTKKSDQPENSLDSEENGDKPDHLMGPKRISEELEKPEMSFEIGDHSTDTAASPEIGNHGDDSSEAGENSAQSAKAAESKDTSEQSETGILSMEISDQTENIIECEDHSDRSPDNIESKVVNNQSDDTGISESISEEPGIIMDSRERSPEASTTNGTGNSDRLASTVEAFGSNSEAITVMNSAESIDQSNRTSDPIIVRSDESIYNVSSKDLNIVSCTSVHNADDESNIQYPPGFMDAQRSTAASPPQVESPHQSYRRDSEVQIALDSEIERQLACLLESSMRNTPQSNPRGVSPEASLPAACVGLKGMEGDPLGQDGDTTYLYELRNDQSMSPMAASATQDATLGHCVTGTPSSELWEIPSHCLPLDEQFVEDDSRAPSLGASPPSNSHHTDLGPEACSGSVRLDTVRCRVDWTQHPEATPERSSLSIPSALLLQSNGPSGEAEEAVLFVDVGTMRCGSSFHLSDVDDSMRASDGPRDIAFQPYGQDDTVSPSLQVGHVCEATESKAPAKGDQCEDKLQKDISQSSKSPSPEHFRRPDPDLDVVPTKGDLSEQEGGIRGSEHLTFTSDTNDEEPAYDTLIVERYMYAEDVPDGNPTLVNPSASEEEPPLQRASHEHAFTEGLRAPACLRAPQAETDRSLNLNLGDVFPLDSGTDPDLPYEGLISESWPIDSVVGGFNEIEETGGGRYVGEGHREAHEVPLRIHPYGFKVDFTKFHRLVPPPLQGADEVVQEPPAASNPDLDNAGYEVRAAAEVVHRLPLGKDSTVDTSPGWGFDLPISDTASSPIKGQMSRPIHFYNPFKWHEHSRPSRSFSEVVTVEPQDVHAGLWSPVNPRVLVNSLPFNLPNDGSVLGAETSPIPDLSPASENVFLSPQVKFAPVTVIAGTAEPKTQSNWVPTWKVPDDSVLQALTRKIGSPKLSRRTCKVYRTRGGSDAGEIRHKQSTPFLISHIGLPEEKVPAETAVREPDRMPSMTSKVFKIAPKPVPTKVLFKQAAVSEDTGPNGEEVRTSAAQSTGEAALPAQGMDYSSSDPVQLRRRHDPFTSSNIVRRHSKLINSSRQLYQEYSDEALNQAIERQKRGETFLEEPEPSSPRLRRKLMSTPDSYLQRLSVSSSAALWQDIPMIRGTSALLSMTREEQKLQEAKFELIMSEASYLRSLNIAVDHFQHSPELQTLLSNQERQWLFSRLQEVRDVSSNFLYDLEEKFEDNMYTFNVCDVVLSHAADFRKVYLPYVTNQSYQDQTFQRLLSGNPRFQQVLARLESDPVCQRLSLKSFLILPFQRITRLKLLVQNILKRTRPGSREEAPATQAYSLLEQLIKDCNENVQRMRSTEELIYLSQKIEFECKIFPLISQSRRLVKQGELLELESSTPLSFKWKVITRPIYLHLFNDCLLLSRRREGAKFLVFDHAHVSKVHGEKCEIKMHGNSKNLFRLILQENNQGRKVEFLLRTDTQSEKLRWITALAQHKKKPDFLQCHDNPQVQCLKSYKAREHDELSLEKADVLMVTQQSKDGWMEGTRLSDGEHGWFPVENVEDISNKHVRLRNLKEEQRVQHARAKLIPPHHQR
ncbi:uncharacterized protein LOC144770983 [Lissotriton helveticus]